MLLTGYKVLVMQDEFILAYCAAGDRQHGTVPTANSTVTSAEECAERAGLRLSVPQTHKRIRTEGTLGVMGMFITWIVVMVSSVFAHAQTHLIIYIKYAQFFYTYRLLIVLQPQQISRIQRLENWERWRREHRELHPMDGGQGSCRSRWCWGAI